MYENSKFKKIAEIYFFSLFSREKMGIRADLVNIMNMEDEKLIYRLHPSGMFISVYGYR
jgi:hypothetical protein